MRQFRWSRKVSYSTGVGVYVGLREKLIGHTLAVRQAKGKSCLQNSANISVSGGRKLRLGHVAMRTGPSPQTR